MDTIKIAGARYSTESANGFTDESIIPNDGRSYVTIKVDRSTPKYPDGNRPRGVDYAVVNLKGVFSKYCEDLRNKWSNDQGVYWELTYADKSKWRTRMPLLFQELNGFGSCNAKFQVPHDALEQVA